MLMFESYIKISNKCREETFERRKKSFYTRAKTLPMYVVLVRGNTS